MHVSTLMKYFFDSEGCTRTCSIISTQYSGWDVFFVSLNGFSRLVNGYGHKHSVKLLSIVCCTVQVRQCQSHLLRTISDPRSPTLLLVCVSGVSGLGTSVVRRKQTHCNPLKNRAIVFVALSARPSVSQKEGHAPTNTSSLLS